MVRISKIILYITLAILAIWQLPWCYSFFTAKEAKVPFTLYSTLTNDFISMQHSSDKGLYGEDSKGNTYTRDEVDSLLPFFYMRQLVSEGRFPHQINGEHVDPRSVQMTNFNFRNKASDINRPKIGLYPLLETKSGRVDLEMSEDVFRITNEGIEFIVMKTNTVDEAKSHQFTEMMQKKGFIFPHQLISGNPTTHKEYDEGYLLTDSEGKLFHLKRVVGRPYVRHIELPDSVEIDQLFITEFRDHKTLAFIADKGHKLYVLNNGEYKLYYTGIDNYNPTEHALTIFGNMMDWTAVVEGDDTIRYYALDANTYSIIRKTEKTFNNVNIPGLHFTSYKDRYVKPRFD